MDINPSAKYTIVGRYTNGVKVAGYYLMDEYGRGVSISKAKTELMALNKQILNCTAQRYKDMITMKGTTKKLSELPSVDVSKTGTLSAEIVPKAKRPGNIKITGRLLNKKFIVGYIVVDEANVERRLSREQVMSLAKDGRVSNARVQKSNEDLILRGVDCKLSALPGYKMG